MEYISIRNNEHIKIKTRYKYFLSIFVLLILMMTEALAEDKTPEFFTFTFENDIFVGNDDGYTNGTGITFGKGPFTEFNNDNLPHWLHWLTKDFYISTMKNKRRGIAHMFFQRMQTPEDLSVVELIENDVPYAGLLAWQGTLFAWDDSVSDHLSLYLGVVGPVSLAEETQDIIHKLTGSDKAMGWNNQIGNEPVFKVEAQRVWNLYRSNGQRFQYDIIGLATAGIGNLESATKAGFAMRWGTHLVASFATYTLQADRQVNPLALSANNDFYFFLGGVAGIVFNDILINGNTFKDSHSVPLEHYQNQVSTGVVWNFGHTAFVFQISSFSSRTKLFNERKPFGA
ncbi:MAG: lipid A deacylase LpxR family protein, partial [Thiohalomonadales bacterium]